MAVIGAINEGTETRKWGDIKNVSRILKNIEVMFNGGSMWQKGGGNSERGEDIGWITKFIKKFKTLEFFNP